MIEILNKKNGKVLITLDANTLTDAHLICTDLRHADLRHADLRHAD